MVDGILQFLQPETCIGFYVMNNENLFTSVTVRNPIYSSRFTVSVATQLKPFKQYSFKVQIPNFQRANPHTMFVTLSIL